MNAENKGRKGDKYLGHLTPGEIVIPRAMAEDEDLRKFLAVLFRENGVSLQKFIVGSDKNSINPETGYIEFGWFSKITKSVKKVFKGVVSTVGGLFGMGDAPEIKMPEVPAPAAIPESSSEGSDWAMRAAMKRSGFQKAILTGNLKPMSTGKKTVLG